jgi:hypothetical protein
MIRASPIKKYSSFSFSIFKYLDERREKFE